MYLLTFIESGDAYELEKYVCFFRTFAEAREFVAAYFKNASRLHYISEAHTQDFHDMTLYTGEDFKEYIRFRIRKAPDDDTQD